MSAEISGIIASAVSAARTIQTATASNGGATALAAASQAAREAASDFQDAYFKQRKFDPYLTFASEEEERAYRKREEERQKEIEKAMALNTPEGDRRAAQLAKEQLLDAGAHGADRSPDYQPLLDKLTSSNAELAAQIETTKSQEVASAVPQKADPLDAPAVASPIPPELLASLRAAGVKVPDQHGTGHGIADNATKPAERGAGVPL